MQLLIDTTEKNLLKLSLLKDSDIIADYQKQTEYVSDDIFTGLEKIFTDNGISLDDIELIYVNPGPGPFTSVRAGVTVANALAFAKGINVAKYPTGAPKDMILPEYDREPNIT